MNKKLLEFVKVGKTYNSKHGDKWFHIYFKDTENKKSYRTALYQTMRNFKNWKQIVEKAQRGDYIDNLKMKLYNGREIVDADSLPVLIPQKDMVDIEQGVFEQYYGM